MELLDVLDAFEEEDADADRAALRIRFDGIMPRRAPQQHLDTCQ